jgi:hypothetical protein
MSKERELLRRVKVLLECSNMEPLQRQTDLIVGEIIELLSQPEQAVAECTNSDTWNCKYCNKTESCGALKDSRNFAPPAREGLTPREGLTEYKKGYAQAELDLKRQPLTNENSDTVSAFNPVSNNYWSR